MAETPVRIGVIGGSGLYRMPQLTDIEERDIETPFGSPSDSIIIGTLNGVRVAFIPRHGRGHVHLPSEVPYRANIFALKTLGVETCIAVSACGSLREDYEPGHIVVPDQLYDNTKGRKSSFFGGGFAVHVGTAEPVCVRTGGMVSEAVKKVGGAVKEGGAFVTIEGPRFSTKAESNVYRSWGMSIIGMTTSPEAFLAREAEMCYAVMAHVTDYDVWHESEEAVTVDMVVRTFNKNLEIAQNALAELVVMIDGAERSCECKNALAGATITDPRKIPPEAMKSLRPLIGRHFD